MLRWFAPLLALAASVCSAPEHPGPMGPLAAPDARPGWRHEARMPELVDGAVPAPQGLAFIDARTLLVAAHQQNRITILYRFDTHTGQWTGRATTRAYQHLNSVHVRPNGEVWANAWVPALALNRAIRIDVDASFRTGELVVTAQWDNAQIGSAISFFTAGGTEYVLAQQWGHTGTRWLYVFRAAQMSGPVTEDDRVARFDLGLTVQDVEVNPADGLLYASRNRSHGDTLSFGWVQVYDIAKAIAAAPDGAVLQPIMARRHATKLVEGIAFDGAGRLWSATEGAQRVGDSWDHAALWSTALTSSR